MALDGKALLTRVHERLEAVHELVDRIAGFLSTVEPLIDPLRAFLQREQAQQALTGQHRRRTAEDATGEPAARRRRGEPGPHELSGSDGEPAGSGAQAEGAASDREESDAGAEGAASVVGCLLGVGCVCVSWGVLRTQCLCQQNWTTVGQGAFAYLQELDATKDDDAAGKTQKRDKLPFEYELGEDAVTFNPYTIFSDVGGLRGSEHRQIYVLCGSLLLFAIS